MKSRASPEHQRLFHFPFAILHFPFAIAEMTNGKCNMANGKCSTLLLNGVMAQAQIFRLLFFLRFIFLSLDRREIGGLHLANCAPGVIEPVTKSPVRKG